MRPARGELAKRVGVAVVGIPIVVGLAYLGGYWFAALAALLAGRAAWEFYAINADRGVGSFPRIGTLVALLIVLLAASLEIEQFAAWTPVLALALVTPALLGAPEEGRPTVAAALTVFGAAYTGGLLAFAVWLRGMGAVGQEWSGLGILFYPVVVTWLADTAAYFGGRGLGRHRLAPTVSPGKTWEGAVAGVLTAVAVAVAYVELTGPWVGWTLSAAEAGGFGFLVAVAGLLGDLVESKFKRDCGVKDSSSLLPGHGGVLDRLDSLLFAFPVGYVYLRGVGI